MLIYKLIMGDGYTYRRAKDDQPTARETIGSGGQGKSGPREMTSGNNQGAKENWEIRGQERRLAATTKGPREIKKSRAKKDDWRQQDRAFKEAIGSGDEREKSGHSTGT